MSQLEVELVAADRQVWSGEASQVTARSIDGDVGILPGHSPVALILADGEVRIQAVDGIQTATVDGGFLSVDHDRVTIISEVVDASAMTA